MKRGFTIIELLVAMTIMLLLLGLLSGLFVSALKTYRYNLAYQELLNQTSYLMEYVSRAVRMAQKALDNSCITQGSNYELSSATGVLKFVNYEGKCQSFFVYNNIFKETIDGGDPNELTSGNLTAQVKWNLAESADKQPRVTIFLDIKGKENTEIKIQTTVSQRNLNVGQE